MVLPVVLMYARPEFPSSRQFNEDFMNGDDSLVRLISASKAKLMTIGGVSYRKVEGPAIFLHNNTYLKCDEALWNVDSNFIDATGNVQIIQKETRLLSDRMNYFANRNLVQFRGSVVELIDKDTNILRTRFLDYHTKDSVANFFGGGSMKDENGKIIESIEGSYDSKAKVFSFENNVEMYADGMLAKTQSLDYNAETDIAFFKAKTYIWNDDNFLVARKGKYDSNTAIIEFDKECCILTPAQEIQSDKLFYYRKTAEADLYDNVQIEDIEQDIMMFGDYAYYAEEPFRAYLTRKPAFALYGTDDDGRPDTLFMSADTLLIYKKRYREIDSMEIVRAEERLKLINVDPIADKEAEARKQAAAVGSGNQGQKQQGTQQGARPGTGKGQNAAAQKGGQRQLGGQQGAQRQQGGRTVSTNGGSRNLQRPSMMEPFTGDLFMDYSVNEQMSAVPGRTSSVRTAASRQDSLPKETSPKRPSPKRSAAMGIGPEKSDSALQTLARKDSVLETIDSAMVEQAARAADSLPARDSIELVRDTMQVTVLRAHNHVKIYRRNMQGCADSLIYTTLDSITRLYKNPILWNGPRYQFTADSMQVVIEHESLKKANLINSAFVISHEDSVFFNQIKSTEMTAFFDKNNLSKFDALGGVNAIFYLKENTAVSMMNKKEAKMMSVRFKDKEVNRLKYYEDIKNDLISVVGLDTSKQKLRDFQWRIKERPYRRSVVTSRSVKKSQRTRYANISMPDFPVTNIYFDDHMEPIIAEIKQGIADRKAARLAKKMQKTETTAEEEKKEIKKDIEERRVEKREEFVKSIVTEEKVSYFTLYIQDKPKARLNNIELNRMKANVTYLFKDSKAEAKRRKKEMKRISKNALLREEKSVKENEK